MAYQDRWIRGATTTRGDRACEARYDIIRPVITPYTRQITAWDLGANLGYFGCRLAHEFGAVSVMVDSRQALVDSCRANAIPTTIAMTRRLSYDDLLEASASEHADVVLALNVLHHMRDWREALPAVLTLGENVIIETPGRDDVNSANYAESQALLDALIRYEPETIGTSLSHVTPGVRRPLFLYRQPKTRVLASYAFRQLVRSRGPHPVRPHIITSTLSEKSIRYADGESRPWQHGMNLWNWLQLGGSYPDRSTVQQAARCACELLSGTHGDFKPWNLILQGQTLKAIDSGHRYSVDDADGLADTLRWIDRPELAYVR